MAKTKAKKIKEFQEEIAKPIVLNKKDLFYQALPKEPEELTKEEIDALIYRVGYLNDDERYKFRNILVIENVSEADEARLHRILTDKAFNKYFPSKDEVEEHYLINFRKGRKE